MADIVFGVELIIETEQAVKRMEGSLAKFGNAFQKELETQAQKTTEVSTDKASKWSGLARSALSGVMNPLLTIQEMNAKLVPELARTLAEKIPLIGNAVGVIVKETLTQGYQRTGYISTGAKQAVSSQAAYQAALGAPLSKEQIEQSLKLHEAMLKTEWEARKMVTAVSSEILEFQDIGGVKDAIAAAMDKFLTVFKRGTEGMESMVDNLENRVNENEKAGRLE